MAIHFKHHRDTVGRFRAPLMSLFKLVYGKPMSRFHYTYYYQQSIITACSAWDNDKMVAWYAVSRQPLAGLPGGWLSLDTMVHPDYRGHGLFTKTAKAVYELLDQSYGDIATVYGFANQNSYPGFSKKLGMYTVGKMYDYTPVEEYKKDHPASDSCYRMSGYIFDIDKYIHIDHNILYTKQRFPEHMYSFVVQPDLLCVRHKETGILVDMQCSSGMLGVKLKHLPTLLGIPLSFRTVEGSPLDKKVSDKWNKTATKVTMICSKDIPASKWFIMGGVTDTI